MKNTKNSNKKRIVTVVLGIGIFLSGAVLLFTIFKNDNKDLKNDPAPLAAGQVSGPTESEKQETDQHKDELLQQMKNEEDVGNTKSVSTTVTTATRVNDEVIVTAYISGIIEDGGTCRFNAKKGSKVVTHEVEAFSNVSSTSCKTFTIPVSSFEETGSWEFTVQYQSSTVSGISKLMTLEL